MIRYLSNGSSKFDEGGGYICETIDSFISIAKEEMCKHACVVMNLQPGDCINYIFSLHRVDSHTIVVARINGGDQWCKKTYIDEPLQLNINPCTLGLINELIARIFNMKGGYYDFTTARPNTDRDSSTARCSRSDNDCVCNCIGKQDC